MRPEDVIRWVTQHLSEAFWVLFVLAGVLAPITRGIKEAARRKREVERRRSSGAPPVAPPERREIDPSQLEPREVVLQAPPVETMEVDVPEVAEALPPEAPPVVVVERAPRPAPPKRTFREVPAQLAAPAPSKDEALAALSATLAAREVQLGSLELEPAMQGSGFLSRALRSGDWREAIVLAEVLGTPVSMRERPFAR
ncbi:MAG TPA: hypothetical protein VKE69_07885 [Planctomycetota bacterium]|nr:hypothetical protein [Planctomycetota bacterium]